MWGTPGGIQHFSERTMTNDATCEMYMQIGQYKTNELTNEQTNQLTDRPTEQLN
jgi:hypothetical protein